MHHLGAHGVEGRPGAGEGVFTGPHHDGEGARCRAHHAAGDGGIDEGEAPCFHFRRHLGHRCRRAGGHEQDRPTGGEGIQNAAGEEHVAGLGDVHHHKHGHVRPGTGGRGGVRRLATCFHEGVAGLGAQVEAGDLEAPCHQVARHGQTHGAETDEADGCHSSSPWPLWAMSFLGHVVCLVRPLCGGSGRKGRAPSRVDGGLGRFQVKRISVRLKKGL